MPTYPGAGRDLRVEIGRDVPQYPMGHPDCEGAHSDLLLVREVAMMLFMERITDKPNWHLKIYDPLISAKYTKEALDWPVEDLYNQILMGDDKERELSSIFNERTIDYCIRELRAKAKYFSVTGIIPTLDASYSIAKSDVLVDSRLHDDLRIAFDRLRAEQASNPDWHPRSNEMIQDLVHPSMYPLVYGRSKFIADEVVGVGDAIDKWAGKGNVLPKPQISTQGRSNMPKSSWSTDYQWLPSNLRFKRDGGVEFTSYINNLHPVKHRDAYRTIERLIEKTLPMWNQCLAQVGVESDDTDEDTGDGDNDKRVGAGPLVPRFAIPEDLDDDNEENWDPPEPEPLSSDEEWECSDSEYEDQDPEVVRWKQTREAVQPEVGDYEPEPGDYLVENSRRLENMFKNSGLQVIVKMVSIELGPLKPVFPPGQWHIEGQLNERIVGTALYYVDSENVMPTELSFRMSTDHNQMDNYPVSQGNYTWLNKVYGASFGGGPYGSCLQNYGKVATIPGRLLAFPNVFQHRVSGIELKDRSKPGRRSFIALWLIDPFTRIISTANVPPQREDWLSENPRSELRQQAENGLPMGEEEAKEHRLKLMEQRTAFHTECDWEWRHQIYNFCEH